MPEPTDAAAPQELAAFLKQPASYPHSLDRPGGRREERAENGSEEGSESSVEYVETHLSSVALAGRYVYKVKKPVDVGFADFSTLERRKHFCEEEVRLNRRLCAGVYEGVVPIRRTAGGGLTFEDSERPPVAFAVRMRRLPGEGFLDRQVDAGTAGEEELDRVARRLAAFYREQSPTPEEAQWGRPARLKVSTDENFEAMSEHVGGDLLSRPAFETIRYYTNRFFDQRTALLNRRRAEGHILEGHGDLRLEHVHLPLGEAPAENEADGNSLCIFDCIEFSERLRAVDVANDVAFLAMDLDFHEAPGLALFFTRRMAELLDDPALPPLANFYKCYRACVRGKVDVMQSHEEGLSKEKRDEQRRRARRHYQQALRYAVVGSGPAVIAVMGRAGTGKSTQAEALADALGCAVARSDRTRKQLAGVPLHERPDAAGREALYAPEMTEKTYATLRERALEAAEENRPLVLDATFGKKAHRDALRDALAAQEVPHAFAELTASDEILKERLTAREGTSQLSDARREDFQMLAGQYEAPTALEDARHFTIDATAAPDDSTTALLGHLVRLA